MSEAALWALLWFANPLPDEGAAAAAPRAALAVEVSGQCPSRESVLAALRPALGGAGAVAGAGGAAHASQAPPRVSDLGERFAVAAFGQSGEYADAARDCAERARVAAVFITLALDPPALRSRSEPAAAPAAQVTVTPPPPPRAPDATPDGASAAPSSWASLGVSARVDGAVAVEDAPAAGGVAAGAELRGALGRGPFGVMAAAGILTPTESTLSFVAVRQQRFPCSVAVTGRRELGGGFAISGALGAALVPLTLRGAELQTSTPATRLDVGVRAAIELRYRPRAHRAVPFLDAHLEYFPRPYELEVGPLGALGSTGHLWAGLSAGVAFEAGGGL